MPKLKATETDANFNIYERCGRWYIRYELGGVERRQSLGTADVKSARKKRDAILSGVSDQREGRQPEVVRTWQDAVEGYVTLTDGLIKSGDMSAKTASRYQTSIVQITLAVAGDPDANGHTKPVPLSDITKATLLDFVEARRADERESSTILNDLTAWSRVLAYAAGKDWCEHNVARAFDRRMFVGGGGQELCPPDDDQVAGLIQEVDGWRTDMGILIRWLRETGMRLGEALCIQADDIHPDRQTATLSRGVKRGKVRTIDLGRAALLLDGLPRKGRLFAGLNGDSAVVSTRYGQWRRQRQGREDKAALVADRDPETLTTYRLHDMRHAFAIASVVDDDTCLYRLMEHLGHASIKTTELYARYLRGAGAMRRHGRRVDLFGSLGSSHGSAQKVA